MASSVAIYGKRKRVLIRNKFYLMIILPEFYETNLKRELGRAEYLLLKILINLLQSIKSVSIEAVATALPIPILFESRRKKIQRFLSLNYINVEEIWFPILKSWLEIYFPYRNRTENFATIKRFRFSTWTFFLLSRY
ncbi:hypothetical protein IQ264_24630 [Phormidium sp. LEGE 05292]|nr:hypothetical protein [Phormidium sp. LEGE 05292]